MSELVANQIAKAERNGREMSRPEAFDEVVADSMESMLTDENAAEFLERIAKRDKGLKEKIVSWLKELAEKLKNALTAYKDVKPDSPEGKMVAEMEEFRKEIMGIYSSALVDAGENFRENGGNKNTTREGGVKYQLREYSEQQKINWSTSKRIVIYENQQQLLKFIRESIENNTMDKKMYFGAIPSDLAARIKADSGVDVENYNLSLGSYEVRKILKDHGNENVEAPRGQRAIVADDFAHIVDIVQNPRSISPSENTYNGKPAIVFSGEHNGRMNVVAVVSDKRLDLFVQTVYVNVKKGNLSTPIGELAPINTPEASSGTVSSNKRVPQQDYDVKQKNSDRDSDGRQLSDGQREYFKDSQVRDDDGRLIPVYHSTHEDFYTFKRDKLGRETLANANDASLAATSLVGHWFSDHDTSDRIGGHPIKCYLKITNPYQTDLDSLAAEIGSYTDDLDKMQEHFENGQYNLVRKAAADFVRWLRFNGYDGLIVDDREFGGTSYVVLNSRQAKLTTNENPTGRNDTRFSDRDPTAEATRAALEKENGKLREDVSRLRELLRLQGKVTGGTVMKQSSVENAARYLNKYAGAKADVKELSGMLTDFYRFLATDKDYSWEDVQQRAMVIARHLQDNVQIKPQISDYARDVLREVRGAKITLNESQLAEVERLYGSYEAFRKAGFGNVTFIFRCRFIAKMSCKTWL